MQTQWTTPLEVVAYIVAHVIGIVLIYIASALFLSGIYVYVAKTYGTIFVSVVGIAQSLVVMLVVLFIFLALRGAMMGGLPRAPDSATKLFD